MSYQEDKLTEIADALRAVTNRKDNVKIRATDFAEEIKDLTHGILLKSNDISFVLDIIRDGVIVSHDIIDMTAIIQGMSIKIGDVISIKNNRTSTPTIYVRYYRGKTQGFDVSSGSKIVHFNDSVEIDVLGISTFINVSIY